MNAREIKQRMDNLTDEQHAKVKADAEAIALVSTLTYTEALERILYAMDPLPDPTTDFDKDPRTRPVRRGVK